MKIIDLELHHYNLFCPATGEQILDEESFNPSSAQLFCYVEGEGVFEYIHEDVKPLLKKLGVDIDQDVIYLDYEGFDNFLNSMNHDLDFDSSILFSITNSGMACGPVSSTAHHCIDMNYVDEALEKDPLIENLPDLDEIKNSLNNSYSTKPTKKGFCAYISDSMMTGGFHFFDSEEKWVEFMPSIVFLDYLGSSYETELTSTKIHQDKANVYYSYFTPFLPWKDKEYDEFKMFSNEVMSDFKVSFVGRVDSLFDKKDSFSTNLIEEFGFDPNLKEPEFLSFLFDYGKEG